MPHHCKLIDPLRKFDVREPFLIDGGGYKIFACIRLLLGTVNVSNKNSFKLTKLRKCYITDKKRRLKKATISEIIDLIFEGDLGELDFERFLKAGGSQNRNFWEDVNGELCLCLVAESSGNHLHAFLHLYRVIERVSVALPLIYASSEPDYKRSFEMLSSLKQDPRDGELAIFKNFSKHLAASGGYKDLKFAFEFFGRDRQQSRASDEISRCVFPNSTRGEIRIDKSGFDVDFENIPSALIDIRNRIFHYSQSGSNFNLDLLDGVDLMCRTVNKPTLNWLSLVIVEIIKVSAKRVV